MPTIVSTGEGDIWVSSLYKAEVLHAADDRAGGLRLQRRVVDVEPGRAERLVANGTYRELLLALGDMVEKTEDVSGLKQRRRHDWLPPDGLPVAVHIRRVEIGAGIVPVKWQTMLAVALAEGVRNIANLSYPEPGASWATAANKSTTLRDALTESNITVHMLDLPSGADTAAEPQVAARVAYRALYFGGWPPDIRGGEGLYIGLHPQPAGNGGSDSAEAFVERLVYPSQLDELITPRR